tara:strand:+ start:912 stop:1115 length:204 start_codon:yes stop_codon:yes gene_type:complete
MAHSFKGGFKVGGVLHHHPLTSDEIRFLLTLLKSCKFQGDDLENLMVVTLKLQEEFKKVSKKEEQTK